MADPSGDPRPRAALRRRVPLPATHHYALPGLSPEENRARFGPQAEPHQHAYVVEVRVEGPMDPDTGFVTDLPALDRALEEILGPLRNASLNDAIPEIRQGRMQPSTESLARWLFLRLAPRIAGPAALTRVVVEEDPTLAGEYGESGGDHERK